MKNKKIVIGIIILLVIIAISLAIYFYNKKANSYKLILTEYAWSEYGVNSDDKIIREFKVNEGDIIYSENKMFKDITLTIAKIEKDSITIETNEPMSLRKSEDDGIDLLTKETKFVLKRGETFILTTPTMDAGVNYKFELK